MQTKGYGVAGMNALLAVLTALIWGAVARLAGASWTVTGLIYGGGVAIIFVALCAVSIGGGGKQ